jgi:hypothetical protein
MGLMKQLQQTQLFTTQPMSAASAAGQVSQSSSGHHLEIREHAGVGVQMNMDDEQSLDMGIRWGAGNGTVLLPPSPVLKARIPVSEPPLRELQTMKTG